MKITLSKAQWEQLGKTAQLGLYEFDTEKSKIALVKAKQEFDAIVKSFSNTIEQWRSKYQYLGSNDTASIEVQVEEIANILY